MGDGDRLVTGSSPHAHDGRWLVRARHHHLKVHASSPPSWHEAGRQAKIHGYVVVNVMLVHIGGGNISFAFAADGVPFRAGEDGRATWDCPQLATEFRELLLRGDDPGFRAKLLRLRDLDIFQSGKVAPVRARVMSQAGKVERLRAVRYRDLGDAALQTLDSITRPLGNAIVSTEHGGTTAKAKALVSVVMSETERIKTDSQFRVSLARLNPCVEPTSSSWTSTTNLFRPTSTTRLTRSTLPPRDNAHALSFSRPHCPCT